jgi:hypothetical protein
MSYLLAFRNWLSQMRVVLRMDRNAVRAGFRGPEACPYGERWVKR